MSQPGLLGHFHLFESWREPFNIYIVFKHKVSQQTLSFCNTFVTLNSAHTRGVVHTHTHTKGCGGSLQTLQYTVILSLWQFCNLFSNAIHIVIFFSRPVRSHKNHVLAVPSRQTRENFMSGNSNICMQGELKWRPAGSGCGDPGPSTGCNGSSASAWEHADDHFRYQDSNQAWINVPTYSVQFGIFILHPGLQWRNFAWPSIT